MAIAAVAIAIGITEIVGGWGRLLRSDNSLRVDWIHLLWSLNIVVFSLLYWIGMWPYDLPQKAVPPRVLVQAPPFGWGVVQEAEVG